MPTVLKHFKIFFSRGTAEGGPKSLNPHVGGWVQGVYGACG